MEGIGGVSTWEVQADTKGREYEKFRHLMTQEVNAAQRNLMRYHIGWIAIRFLGALASAQSNKLKVYIAVSVVGFRGVTPRTPHNGPRL